MTRLRVCIGGPRDGETVPEHVRGSRFDVPAEFPVARFTALKASPLEPGMVTTATYYSAGTLSLRDYGEVEFFVDFEPRPRTAADVLAELLLEALEHRRQKREEP